MWNSEFPPNKWVFEKSPDIYLLPSLIQIHKKKLFICLFLFVEILMYLVGKVLDNREILIKGSFRSN